MLHYTETPYGFEYGAATVERLFSNEKAGWVVIAVRVRKGIPRRRKADQDVQVCVSKTGKVGVFVGKTKVWPPRPAGH